MILPLVFVSTSRTTKRATQPLTDGGETAGRRKIAASLMRAPSIDYMFYVDDFHFVD